jgi:glycosyltransferase involved in cell wall biosynthesis
MTILGIFLINQIRTGGDRDYIELLELLAERGNKVFVLLNTCLKYTPQFITPIYLTINYKRHKPPPASFQFKQQIRKYFARIKNEFNNDFPVFIHIHGDIYLKSALLLKKYLKIPLFYASRLNDITKAHTLRRYKAYQNKKEYLFSLVYEFVNRYREKQISKYAEIVCFLNPIDKALFLSRTNRKDNNVLIIPNHIGPPHFTEDTKNRNNSKNVSNIVYVGTLSPSKGLWDLLRAAVIIKNNGLKIKYHVLGRIENDEKTIVQIEKLGLKDEIILEGHVSPFPFLIKCDLFVYPTLYDDWGNVVTEALHCGCPVISTNSSGPSYILKHDELLFNLNSPDEIAE